MTTTDATRDEIVLKWKEAKEQLDEAKALEMELRNAIVSMCFDESNVGTQNIDLGAGWKLKAVVKESYNLSSDTDKVDAVLDTFEDWQAERLVKWSPRLMKKEYDELDAEDRAKLEPILTIKAASPTLELVAPKGQ